jgi:hypothetical protein
VPSGDSVGAPTGEPIEEVELEGDVGALPPKFIPCK